MIPAASATPAAPTPASGPTHASAPTHACLRCGTQIPVHRALCDACNPAGLPQPAASQAHGTVFGGIALAVGAMLVIAMVLVGGVGPFRAIVNSTAPHGAGLSLRLTVSNQGSREGSATCRVWDPTWLGDPPHETFIRTAPIPAGESLTFEQAVNAIGSQVGTLAIECNR